MVTLDADLQNPPEEIGKLLAAMDAGHDYVGSIREKREDSWWRTTASKLMNLLRERITHIRMTDQGCMLPRVQPRRDRRDRIGAPRVNTFIPALAYTFEHNRRSVGEQRSAPEPESPSTRSTS
jgi:undecaprenyl-phosphate 4-deoxy-4-formamido-L-arabinose transferase